MLEHATAVPHAFIALGAVCAAACASGPGKDCDVDDVLARQSLLATALSVRDAPKVDPGLNVVLVTVDGARWQDIFPADPSLSAPLPNLRRFFFEQGVALGGLGDAPVLASGPNFVSLPGYRELL